MARIRLAFVAVLIVIGATAAAAQTGPGPEAAGVAQAPPLAQASPSTSAPRDVMPSWGSLFTRLPGDVRHLPTAANALWLGGGGASALAVHGSDAIVERRVTEARTLEDVLDAGAITGSGLVQIGGALGTFAIGRFSGHPKLASVGGDLVRAQIIATGITQGVKLSVGRRRPDGSRFSFPSGHASSGFATATVLQRTLGWKAGVPGYLMATYVAASRLSEDRHYPSDVIFGAAIGIVAGRAVTVGHGRHTFAVGPVASPGAVGIGFTRVEP